MGDGRRLKEILDERNMSIRCVAKQSGISPTTLYTIVQRDTAIRFDFALRIANVLDIETSEICSKMPYEHNSGEEVWPKMNYFGKDNLPMIDQHLTNYYMLNDEGRKDADQFIESLLKIKKDPELAKFPASTKENIRNEAIMNYSVAVLAEVAEYAKQEDAPIYEGDKEVDMWVRLSDVEKAINKHLN